MSKMGIPWRFMFFLIFAVCGGIITYDVYSSKGFDSKLTVLHTEPAPLVYLLVENVILNIYM